MRLFSFTVPVPVPEVASAVKIVPTAGVTEAPSMIVFQSEFDVFPKLVMTYCVPSTRELAAEMFIVSPFVTVSVAALDSFSNA